MPDLAIRCYHHFSKGNRDEGQRIFVRGGVVLRQITGTWAWGYCHGPDGSYFEQVLDGSMAAEGVLKVSCGCVEFNLVEVWCSHFWAFLLRLDREGFSKTIPGRGDLRFEVLEE